MHAASWMGILKVTGATLAALILAGCIAKEPPDLSGVWEVPGEGNVKLTLKGTTLSAEQMDPDVKALLGPSRFEGEIKEGVLEGKFAGVVQGGAKTRALCPTTWAQWRKLELRLAPDGLALEGRWMGGAVDVSNNCSDSAQRWEPLKLIRAAGQAPVEQPGYPKWLSSLMILAGLSAAFAFRLALVNYLVGPMKRSPNNASAAGWAMFFSMIAAGAAAASGLSGGMLGSVAAWGSLLGLTALGLLATIVMSSKR